MEGGGGIALESLKGNMSSRRIEGGISRSFSICGRKPSVPSTCDDDLRELLMVPMESKEYSGFASGLSESTGVGAMEEGFISS